MTTATMQSSIELQEQRYAIYKRAKAVLATPDAGRRDLTPDEERNLKEMNAQMDNLIDRQMLAARREAREAREVHQFRAPSGNNGQPSLAPAKFSSLGEQAAAIASSQRRGIIDPRLQDIQASVSGSGESYDSDGGSLVEPQHATRLLDRMYNSGQILSRCTRVPLLPGKTSLKLLTPDETSRANGSRWGGLKVYWPDEGGEITGTKPLIRSAKYEPKKATGLVTVTAEILEDVAGLDALLTRGFTEEMSFVLEDLIIGGSGVGKPLGILSAPSLITVSKESGQTAGTILGENVVKIFARFWTPGRASGIWICGEGVETQLLTQGLTFGGKVMSGWYVPACNGEPYGRLLGIPLIPVEYCSALGTVGDLMLIDPKEYVVTDKPPVKALSLAVRFVNNEVVFRFTYRVDGSSFWSSPMTPKNASSTVSPFVTIETRG